MIELKDKVIEVIVREMGIMGKFIVKKQCMEIGIDLENITPGDLPALAEAMAKVMKTFGGDERAEKLKKELLALR